MKNMNNQKGFALILTMVMLAILSILGVMVLNTTNTELSITSNYRMKSDAFLSADVVTEFALNRIINDTSNIPEGNNKNILTSDTELIAVLPVGTDFAAGVNEIDFYTGLPPARMTRMTSVDAYQNNIYWSSGSVDASSDGRAAYYRVTVETEARGRSTARTEKLIVNRGSQVF